MIAIPIATFLEIECNDIPLNICIDGMANYMIFEKLTLYPLIKQPAIPVTWYFNRTQSYYLARMGRGEG